MTLISPAYADPARSAPHEDDGVLLTTGSSEESGMLAVLDAKTLEPIATLHLPIPIHASG